MNDIKIIVADDHANVRTGLDLFLSAQPDMEVVAVVPNGYSALELLKFPVKVDVLVTDYNMPEMDGLALTKEALALKSDLKVIVLTSNPSRQLQKLALEAGAVACVVKSNGLDDLLLNIRKAKAIWP